MCLTLGEQQRAEYVALRMQRREEEEAHLSDHALTTKEFQKVRIPLLKTVSPPLPFKKVTIPESVRFPVHVIKKATLLEPGHFPDTNACL